MIKEIAPNETFTRRITKNDKEYDVIIRSYSEPIRKTENISCFTRVAIMDGHDEWGHALLQAPVRADESQGIFDMIEKHFAKFKNP